MNKPNNNERRIEIITLSSKIDNLVERVNAIHKCLFGDGNYAQNLVADVQSNTRYRKTWAKVFWLVFSMLLAIAAYQLGLNF